MNVTKLSLAGAMAANMVLASFVTLPATALPATAQGLTPIQQPAMLRDLKIPTYVWGYSRSPKAIVVGIHGGCLHGRSYRGLGRTLAKRRCMLVTMDMRGYGKWTYAHFGSKSDETFQYQRSMDDIKAILTRLRAKYPSTPIYCLGESLGANMAMLTTADAPHLVDGVIAVSPFSGMKPIVSPYMVLHAAQVATLPMTKMNLNPYLRTRLANKPGPALEEIRDPLSRNHQSIRELYKSLRVNYQGNSAKFHIPSNIPMLVMVGGQDRLTSVAATIRQFPDIPVRDKQLVVLPDSGHLLVETTKIDPRVARTLSGWIDRQGRGTQVAARMNARNTGM